VSGSLVVFLITLIAARRRPPRGRRPQV